jgi:hypothetical protein
MSTISSFLYPNVAHIVWEHDTRARSVPFLHTCDVPTDSRRFATTKWRGAMMGAVFAMQGFGQFGAGLIMLIITAGFKESLLTAKTYATCQGVCGLAVDKMWRILIGFGAVPG